MSITASSFVVPEIAHPDEASLVRRVVEGDVKAFESLLLEHGHARRLRAWLAVRAPAADLAEEVAQEAFIAAFRQMGRFRAGSNLAGWLRAIGFQCLRQAQKKYAVKQKHLDNYAAELRLEAAANAPAPANDALIDYLERCLERLPANTRALLAQRYHDDMTTSEMAHAAGQSDEWVRTTLFRARQQLRQCIEQRRAVQT